MIRRFLGLLLCVSVLLCGCAQEAERIGGDEDTTLNELKIIDVDLTEESYGIGVDKSKPELLEKVNEFIREAKASGELDEIIDRYMKGGEPKPVYSAARNRNRDQLIVNSTLDFEPFEYGNTHERYGIDMEIISALADYLGKELVIVDASFEMMFMSVAQHKSDMCIGAITINEKRSESVDFSEPYYTTAQNIAVHADNTEFDEAKTAAEVEAILRKKDRSSIIGVESLTTSQSYCEGNDSEGFPGFPSEVRRFRDIDSAVAALADGDIDYVVGDDASLKSAVEKIQGEK